MRLIGYEVMKLLTSPLSLILVILTIALNVFVIVQEASQHGEVTAFVSDVGIEHGHQLNEAFVDSFSEAYAQKIQELSAYTRTQWGTPIDSALQYWDDMTFDKQQAWEEEELDTLLEAALWESILLQVDEIDALYKELDQDVFVETYIAQFGFEEQAERVRSMYAGLDQRLDNVVAGGEHETLFFGGELALHSLLYRTLLRNTLIALSILITLMTTFSVNYEFERRTEQHTYATKRGRLLLRDKWMAVMVSSTVTSALIVGVTFVTFFIAFPYSGLWESAVSSYFNWEYDLPYISWWPLSMAEFLIMALAVTLVLQFIVANLAFVFSVFIRNSYVVFFVMLIAAGALLILPQVVPMESVFSFVTAYTPFSLMMDPHYWFMVSHPWAASAYYEVITLAAWLLLAIGLAILSMRHFRKQAI